MKNIAKIITAFILSVTILCCSFSLPANAYGCNENTGTEYDQSDVVDFIRNEPDKILSGIRDIVFFLLDKISPNITDKLIAKMQKPSALNWDTDNMIDLKFGGAYPRLYLLSNGDLLLGYDGIYVTRSTDNGLTWSNNKVRVTGELPGCANTVFYEDENGILYLGYRSTCYLDDGSFYSSIKISISYDLGYTWQYHSCVYENTEEDGSFKGVWEPHIGMLNGMLTVFYSNDSTDVTKYQNIEYKQWDVGSSTWINRTIVTNGNKNSSRDGMPVWTQLTTGEYVCVTESFDKTNNDCFCINLTYSKDGKKWSDLKTIIKAKVKGTVCSAPYIVELPDGRLAVSYQTNEITDSDNVFQASTAVSDGTSISKLSRWHFSEHTYPFPDDKSTNSMWNGLFVLNDELYITTSGAAGSGIRINKIKY